MFASSPTDGSVGSTCLFSFNKKFHELNDENCCDKCPIDLNGEKS